MPAKDFRPFSVVADVATGILLASLAFLPPLRAILGVPSWSYILSIGGLLVLAALRLVTGRRITVPLWAIGYAVLSLVLFAWLLLSAAWTTSVEQFREDAILVVVLVGGVAGATLTLTARAAGIAAATVTTAACCFTLLVLGQYAVSGGLSGYNVALLDYYLTISTLLALGAIIGFVHAASTPKHRALWGIAGFISLGGLALSLARGALVFTLLLTLVFGGLALLTSSIDRRSFTSAILSVWGRGTAILLAFSVLAIGAWGALQVERTRTRFLRLLTGGELSSEGSRVSRWIEGIEQIAAAPFLGYGLGSSGKLIGHGEGDHPHNLFLQIWLDGGLFAFVLLFVIIGLPLIVLAYRTCFGRLPRESLPLLAGFLLLALEYSKSYSIYTGRTLFVFGLLAVFTAAVRHPLTPDSRKVAARDVRYEPF